MNDFYLYYMFHIMQSRNNNIEVKFFRGKKEINTIRGRQPRSYMSDFAK